MPAKTQKAQPPAIATQALDLLERGLDANATAATNVGKAVAERLPEFPAVPFAERIPSAEDIVKSAFAVADRLLDIQREYALKIVGAFKPVREKVVNAKTNGAPVNA